jgi:hypothetical protein
MPSEVYLLAGGKQGTVPICVTLIGGGNGSRQ